MGKVEFNNPIRSVRGILIRGDPRETALFFSLNVKHSTLNLQKFVHIKFL